MSDVKTFPSAVRLVVKVQGELRMGSPPAVFQEAGLEGNVWVYAR